MVDHLRYPALPSRHLRGRKRLVTPIVLGSLLAAASAFATPGAGGGDTSGGDGFGGKPATGLRQAHWTATPRAVSRQPRTVAIKRSSTPETVATGILMVGGIHFSYGNGQTDYTVFDIQNQRSGGTSGDLVLHLVFSAQPPPTSGTFTYHDAASVDVGNLDGGTDTGSFDSGEVAFSNELTPECLYVSLLLLEDGNFADIRTFDSGTKAQPEPNGYSEFPLGGQSTCVASTTCVPSGNVACLVGGRFQVTALYDNASTGSGTGQILQFSGTQAVSDESVFYYFTDSSNFEVGVKVLDACSFSPNFWVFLGGLTNQWFAINVLDTQTGRHKSYGNALNSTAVTITDTAALPCP